MVFFTRISSGVWVDIFRVEANFMAPQFLAQLNKEESRKGIKVIQIDSWTMDVKHRGKNTFRYYHWGIPEKKNYHVRINFCDWDIYVWGLRWDKIMFKLRIPTGLHFTEYFFTRLKKNKRQAQRRAAAGRSRHKSHGVIQY